jgi:N-carbamoyl-L-amino-acid hydrolase
VKAISSNAVDIDLDLAATLFGQLERATRQGGGIVRDSYGPGEQAAHDIVQSAGERIGLEVSIDAIGNLAMTLPGKDRRTPRILIGSHLDSVPQGGNFDGAAGVVAGLCALAALRESGVVPACDIGVMAIRAEESSWFDVSYLGSAGALGLLDPQCLSYGDPITVVRSRRLCWSAGSIRQPYGNAKGFSSPSRCVLTWSCISNKARG